MAYRDRTTKKWIAQWYAEEEGRRRLKKKRGFESKAEALDYELNRKNQAAGNLNMSLQLFCDRYFEDKSRELKERTILNKRYVIDSHVIPYLGEKSMSGITARDLLDWQKKIGEKHYSAAYERMISNQMVCLFTHAKKYYGLKDNPCEKVKPMGNYDAHSLNFWTLEEYGTFLATFGQNSRYYIMFETLFWTGIRVGELLALSAEDIDRANRTMSIHKTYYRRNRRDMITTPKTKSSIRTVDLPDFLVRELELAGKQENGERLFPIGPEALAHTMKRHIEEAGVKKIRVHDLRHSHVAFLIDHGVEPLLIKERLGHKDIRITLNTYGHLYPNRARQVADLLEEARSTHPFV